MDENRKLQYQGAVQISKNLWREVLKKADDCIYAGQKATYIGQTHALLNQADDLLKQAGGLYKTFNGVGKWANRFKYGGNVILGISIVGGVIDTLDTWNRTQDVWHTAFHGLNNAISIGGGAWIVGFATATFGPVGTLGAIILIIIIDIGLTETEKMIWR